MVVVGGTVESRSAQALSTFAGPPSGPAGSRFSGEAVELLSRCCVGVVEVLLPSWLMMSRCLRAGPLFPLVGLFGVSDASLQVGPGGAVQSRVLHPEAVTLRRSLMRFLRVTWSCGL